MSGITTVGLDIAKSYFQVHYADDGGVHAITTAWINRRK